MDFGPWSAAVLVTKWLLYATVAVAIGAHASAWLLARHADADWRSRTLRQSLVACLAGMAASVMHFQALVGDFARAGLAGMLDTALVRVLWDSPLGTALALRAGGFAAIAVAAVGVHRLPQSVRIVAWSGGSVALAVSFALGGHAAERGVAAQLALALHVLAMALWLGALGPLWQACRALEASRLHDAMALFGRAATTPVAVLLGCGAALIVLLLMQPDARLVGAWGFTLGGKLLAVSAMLLLAALHRWRLVPRLRDGAATARLSRSIAAETLLAILVLAATATLSTAFGPVAM